MQIKGISFSEDPHVKYSAGKTVFKEGDPGDSMLVLVEGIVDVLIGTKLVGTFEAVEILGELAVIEPGPRSATVVAKTDCVMVSINPRRFKSLALRHPEFCFQVMKLLVERLRWMAQSTRAPEPKEELPPPETTGGSGSSASDQMEIRKLKSTIATQAEQIRELQELIEYIGQQQGTRQ